MTDLQERIVSAAYPLFTRNSFRTITLEEIERAAGVSAADFEAEFASLDELGAACLARREREWTVGIVEAGARRRGTTPEGRLLAVFDVFDEWFRRDDFEACTFINVLVEMGRQHPLGAASVRYLSNIRDLVTALAEEADLERAEEFSRSWHILMKGSILSATEGDQDAALRAQRMARDLIARHRRVGVESAPEWLQEHDLGIDSPQQTAALPSMFDLWDLPDEYADVAAEPDAAVTIVTGQDGFTLVRTEAPMDLLIRGASDATVHALVRVEVGGVFCYPCTDGFPRLGPFATPDEALDRYRDFVGGQDATAPSIVRAQSS